MSSVALCVNRPARAGALLVALLAGGCWTSAKEGRAMRADIDAIQQRLARDIEESRKERKKLQKVMEQATALLTRNSADVGAQVERIQAKVDRLGGKLEEWGKKVNDLNQQFTEFKAKVQVKIEGLADAGASSASADTIPDDKDELYELARATLNKGDHKQGRQLMRRFLSRFPTDPRAAWAQLKLGNSYFAEQKFAPAIVEYKKVLEQHKGSKAVPDAFYKIGMAFYQLKFCRDAALFLKQLLRKHRRHSQAARARKVLKLIKRYRRNPKFCRS